MRILILACLFLSPISDCATAFAQSDENKDVANRIDRFIDQRYDGTDRDTEELITELKTAGVTKLKDLETVLRNRRFNYPDTAEWRGKITSHDVQCLHVDYASRYFLFVPKTLDLDKPVSLVVVGHGGNSSMSPQRAEATAKSYLNAYRTLAKHLNTVIVAPASSRGWGQIGNSLILSTVSQIQRALPIDPDRIYITGQSMGGHLSYRSALSLPDRFGAVSPHSGGYDFVAKKSIGNLINVPGYAIWGKREPFGINKDNRTNRQWAEAHELDWLFVEKNGGHEIYQDELPKVAEFFKNHPRDLYRKEVYLRSGGELKFVKTWGIKGWPEHTVYADEKPLRWNMRHWVEVQPRPDIKEPLTLTAVNRTNNQLEITSQNVRELTVFLHPLLVDMDQPVTITVNGEQLFSARVEPDPRVMFNLAREFDDRGRVFWAKVELNVKSDHEVELPSTR